MKGLFFLEKQIAKTDLQPKDIMIKTKIPRK